MEGESRFLQKILQLIDEFNLSPIESSKLVLLALENVERVFAKIDNSRVVDKFDSSSIGLAYSTLQIPSLSEIAKAIVLERELNSATEKAGVSTLEQPLSNALSALLDTIASGGYIADKPATKKESEQDDAHWYAVHCYSGYENKVKHSLEQRIETMGMAGHILEVVVPTEEEIEVRDGKRKTVERRVFPGYVIVRMRMSEDSWHVVRNTPGVTRFIGMGNRPQPLTPPEVSQILKRMEAEAPKIKVNFKTGQKVRITDGPFADLMGLIDRIDTEHAKVVVLVNFFGRDTPVELDFLQVEKM